MWFSSGGERVRETLEGSLSWCERYCVVSDAPAGHEQGDAFWAAVHRHTDRIHAVIFKGLEKADSELVASLHRAGLMRRFTDGTGPRGHFMWFERGEELRLLLAPEALSASCLAGPGVWLFWEGPRGELPDGLESIFQACWSLSVPVSPTDTINAGEQAIAPDYSRPIPSVREVLGIRSTRDFFDLEPEAQERALWSALIGEGAVDLEQAIRLCAERLRAQGFLDYQALRQDGRVYLGIEERLLNARRNSDLFDRPRNGYVRAIQSNLDDLTAEQWRDCLIRSLEEGIHVDRDEAVRLGFGYAQEVYGVNAQRLRLGGRADQALRSAINSCIRQGYLDRDGAAYIVRIAPEVEPTLRGVVPRFHEGATVTAVDEALAGTTPATVADASTQAADPAPQPATPDEQPAEDITLSRGTTEPGIAEPRAEELPATPSNEPAPSPVSSSPLDRNLWELDFPTRTLNWAERQNISSIRELVAWRPEAFEKERNVGRRTVRETRERLEATLGCTWEAAHQALRGGSQPPIDPNRTINDEEVDSTTEALTAGGATGWAQLAKRLTDEQRALSVLEVALPTRMKNFVRAENLVSIGDLFRLAYPDLISRGNIGRKSLNDTIDAVRAYLSERAAPPAAYATFLEAWQTQLAGLETIPRMIVTRRAGMHGTRETLEELGVMLGVTRERVRQIESQVVDRLRAPSRWRYAVQGNLADAFGAARALPLDLLTQDPWWAGIDKHELLLAFVVQRIFGDELFLLEAPSGKRYLTKFPPHEFTEHLENAKIRVAKLEFPIELKAVHEILHSEAAPLDAIMFNEFASALSELILIDTNNPDLVLGYGRRRADEVIAFLSGQAEPVPVGVIEERFGRGQMPDEVLYFKRGVVGLKRHFPALEAWMERLVPAALDVMKERPAGRQWLVPEIHDVLIERGLVPEWLGHWHLASLLRLSGKVDYLGRLRVASKDSGQEERLQYEELLEETLEQAGTPLPFDELLARARVHSDVSDGAAALYTLSAPFVRIDEQRVGLLERDVPGGPQAVAVAIEAVIQYLTDTQAGLTPHQATVLVNTISDVHASWSRQLVMSLLRNETTVRIDRSKNVGLDEWDDVRCPTRPEFIRREVQKAGGELSLRDLYASMEAVYGRAPDRSTLGVLATQVGLTIVGDTISRPPTVVPKAIPSRGPTTITGIPAELREMFDELAAEPLSPLSELRAQINEHVSTIESEHQVNEFVDLQGARLLAQQCQLLLERWEILPIPDRHLAHAAIRYFVSWHDHEHDLDIGGLDDDKQIMNAVLSHLGIEEHDTSALAS